MKRNLLSILLLMALAGVQVQAAISSDRILEPDYVINNGYSEATAEEIMLMNSRVNGQPAEPIYERGHNKFVRFCRNLYGYIDPAQDTDERIHHDIHQSPNFRDL